MNLLLAALLAAALPAAPETRALWVVRTALVSPQEVDRVVDQAAAAGFNTLLVQVRGRGDSFYDSRMVARSILLERQPPDFDPFARLVERARGRGLAVHAWINVLLAAHFAQPMPAGHVLQQHPDWVMLPRQLAREGLRAAPGALLRLAERSKGLGDVEGLYLSPAQPGVAGHLEQVVRELVRGYPLDGFHLDFIRYPGQDWDYSPAMLEAFRREQGGRGDLLAAALREPLAYAALRRRLLDGLTHRLVQAARQERPGVLVSAAVFPDETEAVTHKFQDWPSWAAGGLLDAVAPMTYTADSRVFVSQLRRARQVAGPARLWAGVGAWRLPAQGSVEKIRLARSAGASGVALFSHESLGPQAVRALREGAFPSRPVAGPTAAGSRLDR